MEKKFSCPSCGYQIAEARTTWEMIVCPACSSSLFMDNGSIQNAGKMTALVEEPSLFTLRKRFKHRDWVFTPIGRVRYEYDEGSWDEWYVISENDACNWISVDEGDVAIENLIPGRVDAPPFEKLRVGEAITIMKQRLTIAEKNSCRSIGAEGQLPFAPTINDKYDYIDLLGPKGTIITLEYQPDGLEAYKGVWIDPFEISEE